MSNTRIIEIPATMQTGKGKNHAIRKLRVAAYCRVSTEEEEQQSSFETQKLYYTEKITSTPEWEIAGIYADDGISGVHTKKRDGFNQMIWYDWEHSLPFQDFGDSTQCFLLRIRLSCSHPAVKALLADWRIHRTAFENGRITSSDYLEWMLQWPPTLSAPDD